MSSNLKIILKLLLSGILLYLVIEIFMYHKHYENFPEVNKVYTLDYYFYYGKYKYRDLSKIFLDSTDKNKIIFSEYNRTCNNSSYTDIYSQHYTNINPYSEGYTNKIYIVDFKDNNDEKWVKFQLIKNGKKDNKYYYLKKYNLYKLLN